MKVKTKYDPVFKVTIESVEEDRFSYKREGQRDKWWCYYSEALPEGLNVKVGDVYKCKNVIKSNFSGLVSWKIEFKKG